MTLANGSAIAPLVISPRLGHLETSMARTRAFDEEEVLDWAMALFWRKGFEATSIKELVAPPGSTAPACTQLLATSVDCSSRYSTTIWLA